MQDIRFRLASAVILSAAAFISVQGALAAFACWGVFGTAQVTIQSLKKTAWLIGLILFFGVIIGLTGSDGISYALRMSVLILIGLWVYTEYRPGEFIDIAVWVFGDRAGFDAGMLAEMGIQWFEYLFREFSLIRAAHELKGQPSGISGIVPAGVVLVHRSVVRAGDVAEILAVRGYRSGGSHCPRFSHGIADFSGLIFAIVVLGVALVPVSEFFILYR